jgi:hypothetical protein
LVVRGRLQSRGAVDIIFIYYQGNQVGLPAVAAELGATYAILIIYVPALMITHFVAFYLLVRPKREVARALADDAALWIGLAMRPPRFPVDTLFGWCGAWGKAAALTHGAEDRRERDTQCEIQHHRTEGDIVWYEEAQNYR